MAMVCPQCATMHEQRLQCPACGTRLQYHDLRSPRPAVAGPRWQHTPWGRIFIGLLLAQGLFYGLQHLATGLLLIARTQGEWSDESAALIQVMLTQALRAMALFAGGILAGSGQRNGAALGAVVGVWNGAFSGLVPQPGQALSPVALYSEPLLQLALGLVAGCVGSTYWKPIPPEQPRGGVVPQNRKRALRSRRPLFAGGVAWMRVVLGTTLAVGGTLSATLVFGLLLRLGDGNVVGNGSVFDQVLMWEIKGLALLAGGVLAGYNTHYGLKQGVCVAIAVGLILSAASPFPADTWPAQAGLLFFRCLALCPLGAWFSSQLFPPVLPYKTRRASLGPASLA